MNETMGQIIRRLRKNADLTQEELADQLGVTYQAVSRWENDTGMPDISQIVPLANVFDVPTDVLFGRIGQPADAEIAEFEARMLEADHNPPDFADDNEWFRWRLNRTDAYRKMVELHPNNILLLRRAMEEGVFAVAAYTDHETYQSVLSPDGYRALLEECVKWGDRIIRLTAGSEDTESFYSAKLSQIGAYVRLGKTEKASEIARTLPGSLLPTAYSQEAEIARLTGDKQGEILARARMISLLLETLSYEAGMLGNAYSADDRYAEARECYTFPVRLEEAVYGKESWTPPFIGADMETDFVGATRCLIREGRKEEAVEMLEKFCDHAVRLAEAWNTRLNEPSSSALLKPIPWNYNDKVRMNAKKTLTFWLGLKTFETLRGNPRFDALMKKIEELPE